MSPVRSYGPVSDRILRVLDAAPSGVTSMQIALLIGHPFMAVKSTMGTLRARGLVTLARFTTTGAGNGGKTAVWMRGDPFNPEYGDRLHLERRYVETDAIAAAWADLMAGRRFEDSDRSPPIRHPRQYRPGPDGSQISCAAALCAGKW